jgi:hypothetical protein
MAAEDDLDELEAQLEDYEDDEDDDDLPALKRIWKKYKLLIIPAAAFFVFIPVILISMGGSNSGEHKLVVVPELAPEPGKKIKIKPESPGGEQVAGQDKAVFNVVTEGKDKGKIAITAPPEEPKAVPEDSNAETPIAMMPEGAEKTPKAAQPEAPIAMMPEGAEKTPKDIKSADATMLPPPTPPGKDDEAALPVPDASAPSGDTSDTKKAESILPAPPADKDKKAADAKAGDSKAPEKPMEVATQTAEPAKPAEQPKAQKETDQIAVLIPKAQETRQTRTAVSPPPASPSGNAESTPMRTMAGVYRVQVASARSESAAKTLWDKQVNKHPDLLGQLPLTVQQAVIKDRGTFYRVQGGAFNDRESADSVCRKLKSRGQDCIVVRP